MQPELERLAREAGIATPRIGYNYFEATPVELERFAMLVEQRAIERAAVIAEECVCDTHLPTGVRIYGTRAAAAMRAFVASKLGDEIDLPTGEDEGE